MRTPSRAALVALFLVTALAFLPALADAAETGGRWESGWAPFVSLGGGYWVAHAMVVDHPNVGGWSAFLTDGMRYYRGPRSAIRFQIARGKVFVAPDDAEQMSYSVGGTWHFGEAPN